MSDVVYFVRCEANGLVKVGWTRSLWTRVRELRSMSGAPVTLLSAIAGDRSTERAWHAALADRHSHYEWFALELDDVPESEVDVAPYNVIPITARDRYAHARSGATRHRYTEEPGRPAAARFEAWLRFYGLSLTDAAVLFDVEPGDVSRWRAGRRAPGPRMRARIAAATAEWESGPIRVAEWDER